MKDCLPSLCFKCVIVIGNGKIIQHRTSGAYSCSGESLYFKLPSFDKWFAWHWPFLGFASLHFSFVFCICYCELIVFVLFLTCNMMINASHDNALSSLDFHSLLPLISFYHFRGPSLPLECLDLIYVLLLTPQEELVPNQVYSISSNTIAYNLVNLNRALFNSAHSVSSDAHSHRAAT